MNDHEDTNGRHENEVVNFEGVLPHNPPDDEEEEEEEEEHDDDNDNDDDDTADSSQNDNDDDASDGEESVVPAAEEVELEYTYPDDFPDRSFGAWRTVVRRFFRLIIDPSCTEIPDEIFRFCALLVEIVFPDNSSLTWIGRQSFDGCRNLQRMNAFPEGLIELGQSSFEDCTSLQGRITFPESIRYVRTSCFSGCNAITSVVFDNDPTTTTLWWLGDWIFYCCHELRSVRLPYNLIAIPPHCFQGCHKLTDIPIPILVRVIGRCAFNYCCSLTSMYLSENIDTVCYSSFGCCTSLKCITIRSSNVRFEGYVFEGCTVLSSIKVLPTVWPALFEAMSNEFHPNFIYKFLREYQYQIDRLIEWKKNQ